MAKCQYFEKDKDFCCEEHAWGEYEDIMEEAITKMWRRFGYTDRDWTKTKVIFFNEKSQVCAENKEKFKKMQIEKQKLLMQMPPNLNEKQKNAIIHKKFKFQQELVEKHLSSHDKKEEE